jgi:hypothetical protein
MRTGADCPAQLPKSVSTLLEDQTAADGEHLGVISIVRESGSPAALTRFDHGSQTGARTRVAAMAEWLFRIDQSR